ncbi:MAG: hypothetical protein KAG91_02495, partial [Mycoplasmataceae bacterium]|nr:hypothetical protein [Mycoplasmataceae bacterium]
NNQFSDEYLLKEKKLSDRQARSAVTRSIATVVFGVMKSGKKYDPLMNIKSRRDKETTNSKGNKNVSKNKI